MPGSTFSAAEVKEKKLEIAAVIDFCDANRLTWNKSKIIDFFGVPKTTGYRWFPDTYSPNHRRAQQPADTSTASSISPTSHQQSPPAKRQNPVRNGGRDRKRLKAIVEDLTGENGSDSSPPPLSSASASGASPSPQPQQPLTPPRRKITQPRKKTGSHPDRQLKYEEVTIIKQEALDDEIEV
jgi:hypothetical protein